MNAHFFCGPLRWLRQPSAKQSTAQKEELQVVRDHMIKDMQKRFGDTPVKILLLGTAESGKTTIFKQMRILHINGFTDDERRDRIPEIYQNIHDSIHQLVLQMGLLGLDFGSCTSERSADYILSLPGGAPDYMNEEYCDHVMTLWNDVGIRACYDRSNEFPLLDSAKYFLDNFVRISDCEYIPSTEDILHSRKITTGISQITFRVPVPKSLGGGEQEFRMYDVGGQRDQRNKWIQVFEGIQAVLFLVSCSEFDQNLREDPNQNRLEEALKLFRRVWQNRFLASAGLIVFINKYDIMERKIRAGKHIVDYFPEYEEFCKRPQQDNCFDECDWTKMFIKQKLVDITQEPFKRHSRNNSDLITSERECYYHFTVATDTRCIREVFSDVQKMILSENMSGTGLF
ncbi:guanine nucleotide-binding protein G(f) subunit alpha isoform X1 [Drosophila guanche]|uniref:Blast:Guanine nucleotide-binding protein G(F) subunit alpha n=1 Tax=Drosophila guanche TaxID=7266 RepID=A0A3B0KGM8_DROGU|nr:guanine nucleotide-binding protein G(f) subunit alpha isoform X1 [Drosophila guanche]SPP87570.1 blast:Guanine nucleotide-binding protein G(f) subunit alpha [Drosophila guanche]